MNDEPFDNAGPREGTREDDTTSSSAEAAAAGANDPAAANAAGEGHEGRERREGHGDGGGENDARLRVLRLVAEGKITAEEAIQLLAALGPDEEEDEEDGQEDVFFHAAAPPSPAQMPMPPAPPMPPMAPMPPLPPGRWGKGFSAMQAGDVVMYKQRGAKGRRGRGPMEAVAEAAAGMRPGPGSQPFHMRAAAPRTLFVYTQEGECETKTRIPLTAVENALQFLPKQARQHLATCEIDLQAILSSLGEVAGFPGGHDNPLLHIQEGETEVKISLE